MKSHVIALSALVFAPLAFAQDVPATQGAAALRIYNWCLTLPTGSVSECSCVAGYFAAATDEDEFQILSVAVEHFDIDGSIKDENAVLGAMFGMRDQLGLSEDRFTAIMNRFATFEALGTAADAVCIPVETETRARASDE
jgi:hypothetical protein